ncbi:MAG: LLM class flavin-dependent oxidoreductase, partial [Dehalococcoidia bacterium]
MKMDFGVGMGGELTTDQVAEHARVVEDSGFTYLTLVDTPASARDVHVMMTLAALATKRIRIGEGVVDPMTIHPSVIANIAASIDELSGGRAFIGIGTGNPIVKYRKPATLRELREAIQFIRKFMSGEEAEFNGVTSHSRWITSPLPIYISAHGPKAMQLAGEIANGVISLCVHPEYVKWQLGQVEKGALRAGRDPSTIDTWARCMVYVAESKEVARRETSAYPSSYRDLHRLLERDDPDVEDLRRSLEGSERGSVDELIRDSRTFAEALDPDLAEHVDAPHSKVVTQRLIDFSHLSGTPEEI